jgi:hypothetical protein
LAKESKEIHFPNDMKTHYMILVGSSTRGSVGKLCKHDRI